MYNNNIELNFNENGSAIKPNSKFDTIHKSSGVYPASSWEFNPWRFIRQSFISIPKEFQEVLKLKSNPRYFNTVLHYGDQAIYRKIELKTTIELRKLLTKISYL